MTSSERDNAEKLLAFIQQLDEAHCNMKVWISTPQGVKVTDDVTQRGKPECGTAACLAGWAALALAPTADDTNIGSAAWGMHQRRATEQIWLPTDWADAHGIRVRNIDHRTKEGMALVPVQWIGEALLGERVCRWFHEADHASECALTNREWMIAVLRKELGYSYDDRLDDVEPQWERSDRYDPSDDD